MYLRQSTAGQEIQLGKFVDETDGITAETGLTIINTDIKLFKEGATSQANKNSGGATHMANGYYYTVLDATDSNTVGNLEVTVDVSGALPVRREYVVLPASMYDGLVAGTEFMPVDAYKPIFSISGGVITVKKPDGTTTAYTHTLTTDPAAEPVIGAS
jgi:hypothetical protein